MRPGLLAGLLLLPAAACSTTSVRLDFTPSPAQVLVTSGEDAPQARVLASVLGAERADTELPFELRARLRIENLGTQALAFDAEQLLLVDSDLVAYPVSRVEVPGTASPAWPVAITADTPLSVDLLFGLGETHPRDLDGLNLRFKLLVDGTPVLLGTSFEVVPYARYRSPYYYDPYWGPYWGPYWHPYGPYRCYY